MEIATDFKVVKFTETLFISITMFSGIDGIPRSSKPKYSPHSDECENIRDYYVEYCQFHSVLL